jgi:hypothetical protein
METGRRTGLKILSFLYRGVPVQVRPEAPLTTKLLKELDILKNKNSKAKSSKSPVVDESHFGGRQIYQIKDLQYAKALLETMKKQSPNEKFYLSDFL